MKTFTIIAFGFATGVISSFCGLHFAEEPVKYLLINLPLLFCFGGVLELIDSK